MPRVAYRNARTTKAGITALFQTAEMEGELTILLADEAHCKATRNKLYAHRSRMRKMAAAHTNGQLASSLDAFTFSYGPYFGPDGKPTGQWYFTISYDQIIEFDVIVPDYYTDEDIARLPHFDTRDPTEDVEWEPKEPTYDPNDPRTFA